MGTGKKCHLLKHAWLMAVLWGWGEGEGTCGHPSPPAS